MKKAGVGNMNMGELKKSYRLKKKLFLKMQDIVYIPLNRGVMIQRNLVVSLP